MKRFSILISLLYLLCLSIYSQTCEELNAEYERLNARYKTLSKTSEKKECVKQMELILRRGSEANCGFPQRWSQEIRQRKQTLYPSSLFTQSSYDFAADKDVIKVGVKQKKNIKIISYPNWLEPLETEDNKNLEFSIKANVLPHERSGIIEVESSKKHHKCTITQEGAPLLANITEHIGFGQDGGVSYVFIETNDTAWSISGGDSWLKIESAECGAKVICSANPMKKKRSAKIKVTLACGAVRFVEIGQVIGRTTLSVPQKTFTFDNNGGTNNYVVVQCNYDQWTASSDANWITIKKKYGGISIECLPNQIAATRTARVKIETNDDDNLVEYITVTQKEASAYLSTEKSSFYSDGEERTLTINVNTNIPDWSVDVERGAGWTYVTQHNNYIKVRLRRNDWNFSRTSIIKLYGKDKSYSISIVQPNRGYVGRYNDYFDAIGGTWHITWFSVDFHGMTTVGDNFSFMNFRWKPVEFSLINLNLDYVMGGGMSVNWEPIVRGFMPISRDGKWAAYAGIGAHVSIVGGYHSFLLELGAEIQWNEKYSSRMFFKYNGGCALGMSFDMGSWYY